MRKRSRIDLKRRPLNGLTGPEIFSAYDIPLLLIVTRQINIPIDEAWHVLAAQIIVGWLAAFAAEREKRWRKRRRRKRVVKYVAKTRATLTTPSLGPCAGHARAFHRSLSRERGKTIIRQPSGGANYQSATTPIKIATDADGEKGEMRGGRKATTRSGRPSNSTTLSLLLLHS